MGYASHARGHLRLPLGVGHQALVLPEVAIHASDGAEEVTKRGLVAHQLEALKQAQIRLGEEVPRAKEHYDGVLRDMLGMYDKRLSEQEFVIGDYSIADVACYADIHIHGVNDIGLDEYPNIQRWHNAIEARPAVNKAWTPFA